MSAFSDMPTRQAGERPDATAISQDGAVTTFAALDARANEVANGLLASDLGEDSRIAVLDKNSATYFELVFGAARAGATLVPLNWRLAAEELHYIMSDAEVALLFVAPEFADTVGAIADRLPKLREIITLDAAYTRWRDGQSAQPVSTVVPSDRALIQMYTSGTTGKPKGAILTHGNIHAALENSSPEMGPFTPDDVLQVIMPQFHIAGTMWGLFGTFNGARAEIIREFSPEGAVDNIQRAGITHTFIVPAALNAILQSPASRSADFSLLARVYYGAAPIPSDLLMKAIDVLGCAFVQLYGLTETCGVVTYLPAEDHAPGNPEMLRSCGKPFSGIELRIVGPDGTAVAAGEVGEIALRGERLFEQYWKLPEATKEARPDGWFRTGDAGYLNADGYLFIHDRMKDMIVSGAENIYPAEVENAIFGHDAVAEVGVIGVPDKKWGEAVKACVVLKPGAATDESSIIAFARQRIAGYKVPKSVDFVADLPRNASGKLLRRQLREPYWAGIDRRVN